MWPLREDSETVPPPSVGRVKAGALAPTASCTGSVLLMILSCGRAARGEGICQRQIGGGGSFDQCFEQRKHCLLGGGEPRGQCVHIRAADQGRQAFRQRRRRSEERRVGKEGVRTCRSRWSPYH